MKSKRSIIIVGCLVVALLALSAAVFFIVRANKNSDNYKGGYSPDGTYCDYGYNPKTKACCDEDDYYCEERDKGATAVCNDQTFSFSKSSGGTCSDHKGVLEWIH